jgi:hypothetical protein
MRKSHDTAKQILEALGLDHLQCIKLEISFSANDLPVVNCEFYLDLGDPSTKIIKSIKLADKLDG